MNAQESIEAWFEELSNCGENSQIIIGVMDLIHGTKNETQFSHGKFDGIYALQQLMLKKNQGLDDRSWKLHRRQFPSLYRQWRAFFRYLLTIPFCSAKWNLPSTSWKPSTPAPAPTSQAVLYLSIDETQIFHKKAKLLNVKTNALLLWALNESLEEFMSVQRNRIWLIPVTLRNNFGSETQRGNWTGFFDIHFSYLTSVHKLNEFLNFQISRDAAYGGFIGVSLGRWLGRFILKILVRLNFFLQIRTGVFSNMGSYGEENPNLKEIPYGYPPVLRSQPISGFTMCWQGHQILTLQIHPILSMDPTFAKKILANWKGHLLS